MIVFLKSLHAWAYLAIFCEGKAVAEWHRSLDATDGYFSDPHR